MPHCWDVKICIDKYPVVAIPMLSLNIPSQFHPPGRSLHAEHYEYTANMYQKWTTPSAVKRSQMLLLPLLHLLHLLERELTRPIRNIPPLLAHSALPRERFVQLSLLQKYMHLAFHTFTFPDIFSFNKKNVNCWFIKFYLCSIKHGCSTEARDIIQEKRYIAIGSCCGNHHILHTYWYLLKGTIFTNTCPDTFQC